MFRTILCSHNRRYFLSSTLYSVGTFLGFVGCWLFVKSSYPDEIVKSCFYSDTAIGPPPGSSCLRVHCGTRVLRGGLLQLVGAILYSVASAIWIQEDYLYRKLDGSLSEGDDTWSYFNLVIACLLLLSACYYQLLGQYPDSVLTKSGNRSEPKTSLTDIQVAGWYFVTLAVTWLFRSAILFDQSTNGPAPAHEDEEAPSVSFSEYDWSRFFDSWLSLAMAIGSYFLVTQAYKEGTRMDAVLVQQAKQAAAAALAANMHVEGMVVPGVLLEEGNANFSPRVIRAPWIKKPIPHPLDDISDLTDSKSVLRKARKTATDESTWIPSPDNLGSSRDIRVWVHTEAHAVRFETHRFQEIDPLLLAAVVQSEVFKIFQLSTKSGSTNSSVTVIGKLALVVRSESGLGLGDHVRKLPSHSPGQATVFHEKFPPNPPMPAHEATFASLLHESRRMGPDHRHHEDISEVLEWAVNSGLRGFKTNHISFGASTPPMQTTSATPPNVIKVNPFRYVTVSAVSGTLTVMTWLEDIARWMPEFLLKAEMQKVPSLIADLESFLREKEQVSLVERALNAWIWQKVHNSISPLAAAVLVRTSPAYRVLLSKHPGLRTRVPDPVSVPVGALGHPLEHFPSQLVHDSDIDVAIATKHASDFISNEFGSWHASDDYKAKPGKPKIIVWRQDMEGEDVRPFRIQARIHGVDPMTLAVLIHRNKLNVLVENAGHAVTQRASVYVQSGSVFESQDGRTDPFQSRHSVARASVISQSPDRASAIGEDPEHGGVTVASHLLTTFQEGAVRVYRERKRRTKFLPSARDREFTFASVMKDVSPLKAVVVHFGTHLADDAITDPLKSQVIAAHTHDSDVVKLRKFNAWCLENDGGNDTKLTWCGLVPIGGRTAKMSAWFSSGSELKEKTKFVEKLVNLFANDVNAKEAVSETHQYLAYQTMKTAFQRELRKLSIEYLNIRSEDYKSLLSEIQPVAGGVMQFEQDIAHETKRAEQIKQRPPKDDGGLGNDDMDRSDGSSSEVTVPLSPVESHRRFNEDDDDEVKTQKNSDLDDEEDMIPDERNVR